MGDGRAGAVPGVGGSRVGKRRGTRRRPRLGGAGLALLGGIPPDRGSRPAPRPADAPGKVVAGAGAPARSEEHTSELQSLMRISYAVFCLKKKNNGKTNYQ